MTKAKAPHKAVLVIKLEVHEVLPTGECAAKLVRPDEMAEYGIKPQMVVSIEGQNRHDCLVALSQALAAFKRK